MNIWKARLTTLLLVQLIAAAALWLVSFRGETARGKAAELTDFEPAQVDKIELHQAEESLVLTKTGDSWTIPDYHGLPVDEEKLKSLLDELNTLSSTGAETRTSSSHERFKVTDDAPEARVKLHAGDNLVVHLLLGKSPTFGKRYVRRAGEEEVFRANWDGFSVTARGRDWMKTDLLAVEGPERVSFPQFELIREEGSWKAGEAELDPEKVSSLLSSLTELRVLEVADVQPEPGVVIKVQRKGEVLEYSLFEKDGKHFLKRGDRDLVFQVPKHTAEALRKADLESLKSAGDTEPEPANGSDPS